MFKNRVAIILAGVIILLFAFGMAFLDSTYAQSPGPSMPGSGFTSESFHSDLFTGSASTSIPIEVPSGVNGMAPALALTYNSGGGNSWVGVGWSLEVGYVYRPTRKPNKLVLILPGSRSSELVPASVDASGVGEYRTKIESFMKVLFDGLSWTVIDKNGRRSLFGLTAESRMGPDPATGAGTVQWNLEQVKDPSDNRVLYHYIREQGQLYLNQIDYTSNGARGLSPRRAVKFYLELGKRPDPENRFGGPFNCVMERRLKTIEVLADVKTGERAGVCSLTYSQSRNSNRSLLTEVMRYGSDVVLDMHGRVMSGSAMPPMTFTYEDSPVRNFDTSDWATPGWWVIDWRPDGHEAVITGDFNGDGKTDVAHSRSQWSYWAVSLSTGAGLSTQNWSTGSSWAIDWRPDGHEEIVVGDFNGDGKTDVAHSRSRWSYWNVCLSTGSGFDTQAWSTGSSWAIDWRPDGHEAVVVGDFNGDGKTDIARSRSGWGAWQVSLSTGSGFATQLWATPGFLSIDNLSDGHEAVVVGDFNGDGKTDIARSRSGWGAWQVSLSTGSGFATQLWATPGFLSIDNLSDGHESVVVGDFNGDGKTDIARSRSRWGYWSVSLSTGSGLDTQNWSTGSTWAIDWRIDGHEEIVVGDFNGDGKADIAHSRSRWGQWNVSLSTGSEFMTQPWPIGSWWAIDWRPDGHEEIIVGDVNGDGKTDVAHARSRWTGWVTSVTPPASAPTDGLIRLDNGLGGVGTFSYRPSTQEAGNSMPIVVWTLDETTVSDGRGWTAATHYDFSGGLWSVTDEEFRGFGQATVVDPAGNRTITKFYQDDVKKGQVDWTRIEDEAGRLFRMTQNTYSDVETSPGVFWPRHDRSENYQYDGQATPRQTAVSFNYDSYGNPTRTYYHGDVSLAGDEREERSDWVAEGANWLHRPTRTALYDSKGSVFRERWFFYDDAPWGKIGSRGLLSKEESRLEGDLGSPGNPSMSYAYDPYGNRTLVTDARGCTTTTIYDATQLYPETVATCMGHVTQVTYDQRWGQKVSETDPNNQVTSYFYDVFGRITKVVGPLDRDSLYGSTSYFYEDYGDPQNQRVVAVRTEQHGTDKHLWADQFFDGMGRVYLSRTQGPDPGGLGSAINAFTTFDARGLVASKSSPVFTEGTSRENPVWTRFEYDVLGRQTLVKHPDATQAQTDYHPAFVTLTDERGNVKRKFPDAYGRLVRVEEVNGGETYGTTYEYDAAGNLLRIKNHLGHETVMSYDLLGRKITMTDPNMGRWTYRYDKTGNLRRQINGKKQTLEFTYDLQGRVMSKRYPDESVIRWTYDDPAVSYSKGRLTRVVDPAVTTEFGYDSLGRITTTRRLLGGKTYTLTQKYDALGRVASQNFPDGDEIRYLYNGAGWLDEIPGYIQNITYNARGQREEVRYGNGVVSRFSYHPGNFRLENRSTLGPGGMLQNLDYEYDFLGNITQITDHLYTGSRTFEYDELNRLVTAFGPLGPLVEGVSQYKEEFYRYDAIGNILMKGDIDFTYGDPLHPSAVTRRSDGRVYTYDANGNMTGVAGQKMSWTADNRLSAVTTPEGSKITFSYDVSGERVLKTTPSGTMWYPFPGYEIGADGVVTKYFHGIGKKSTGGAFFYHNDHLGGVNVISDEKGNRVQRVEYDPWGRVTRLEGDADPAHRFTGKQLDEETGLHYYGGRYYDAVSGRFISADPFVPSPGNPQALNRYSYVINNPVNAIDPSGYFFKSLGKFFKSMFDPSRMFEFNPLKRLEGHLDMAMQAFRIGYEIEMRINPVLQSETGRMVMTAVIIVGTAVATWYCGGCGIVVGALIGEVIGAYSAVQNGGDIYAGTVFGGGVGAATGALSAGLSSSAAAGEASGIGTEIAKGAIGGAGAGAAEGFAGGKGSANQVLMSALISGVQGGAMRGLYRAYVGYEATWAPGGDAVVKDPSGPAAVHGAINWGTANCSGSFCEGGTVSRFMNQIPGQNALAGLHDTVLGQLERIVGTTGVLHTFSNYGTMLPAGAFSYGTLMGGVPPSLFGVGTDR